MGSPAGVYWGDVPPEHKDLAIRLFEHAVKQAPVGLNRADFEQVVQDSVERSTFAALSIFEAMAAKELYPVYYSQRYGDGDGDTGND